MGLVGERVNARQAPQFLIPHLYRTVDTLPVDAGGGGAALWQQVIWGEKGDVICFGLKRGERGHPFLVGSIALLLLYGWPSSRALLGDVCALAEL